MVTIGVIAILAAMAMPQFQKTIRRGHRQAATDILRTIYAGEQVYKSANGEFLPRGVAEDWSVIYMDNPNLVSSTILPVSFVVTTAAGNTQFTATATYTPTSQAMTIDETNALNESGWPQP